MPEAPEVRIMSDYINLHSKDKTFTKLYHVERGNIPRDAGLIENFQLESHQSGKEMTLKLHNNDKSIQFSIFMGMSGNWKIVPTQNWNDTKYIRMRLDTSDENSLLLYGSYMGPRYRLGKFTGVKRGPDIVKEFDNFKKNVLDNLNKKIFDKPICEVLLNQQYFSGVGNYLRSTILNYMDINPFQVARTSITNHPQIFEMCRDVIETSYKLNGGQIQDWKNPFGGDINEFNNWVFYKKGLSCKDGLGRTFWFNEKWKNNCTYKHK